MEDDDLEELQLVCLEEYRGDIELFEQGLLRIAEGDSDADR